MIELDWETVKIDTIDEEVFWDLQTSGSIPLHRGFVRYG